MAQIINPNSVQSQFATLSQDRDRLRNAATAADRERRNEEAQLSNLRSTEKAIIEKIRVAHAHLGTQTKKRQLLRDEESRVTKLLADDRKSIEELTLKLRELEREEKGRKIQFIKEMDSLNDDLESALRQYEERCILKMISSESCKVIREFIECKNEMGVSDDEAQWKEVLESMTSAETMLCEADAKYSAEIEMKQQLEERALALRAKMLKDGTGNGEMIGEMELNELERMWEQAWENEEEETTNQDGGGDNPECSKHTNSYKTKSMQSSLMAQEQKQQPINMDLFYGDGLSKDDTGTDQDKQMDIDDKESGENAGDAKDFSMQ